MRAKTLYTARATVTNGREHGHGRTSDGLLDVKLEEPTVVGGPGGATNPEQLFAVGFAACFASAIVDVMRKAQKPGVGELSIESRVDLLSDGEHYDIAVGLDVSLPSVPNGEAVHIVSRAHRICPYSRAMRGNVDVAIRVNGCPLG